MAEEEQSDTIGLIIALEFSKNGQEELASSSKENESRTTPDAAMTTDTIVIDTRNTHEVHTYRVQANYKDDGSISTMNNVGDSSSSRYYY